VHDWYSEEAAMGEHLPNRKRVSNTYLLEESAIPAQALYQAQKAARRPKKPAAWITGFLGAPLEWRSQPIPRRRNVISSQKNKRKNMSVERRVQKSRIVVKMNQPMKKKPIESRNW
jgi:hypothetical protein